MGGGDGVNDDEEQWRGDLIEAYLRFLRGQGGMPDLGQLNPWERQEACQLLELLDAITDMGDDLVAIDDGLFGQQRRATSAAEAGHSTPSSGSVVEFGPGEEDDQGRDVPERSARTFRPVVDRWRRSLGAVAAGVGLVVGSLLLIPERSARAVESGPLTPSCETSFGANPGSGPRSERVVVAAVWGTRERERFEEVLRGFVDRTGIGVDFAFADPQEADRDIAGTLRSLIDQGCPPDVALLPQPGLLRNLAQEGHLRPIDAVVGGEVERYYSEAWQQLGEVDGTAYGVWFKAANKSLIWYNARAFERAGIIEPPADWESLKDVADRLLSSGITPFSVAGGTDDAWTLTDWFENVYLRTAGRERYQELARGEIRWTDPSVTHALERLAEIFARPDWIVGGASGALQTTYEQSIDNVFADPERPAAAMVLEGDFVATRAQDSVKLGVEARFFEFPAIESSESTIVGVGGVAEPVDTGGDVAVLMNDDEHAKDLLRFLATPEAAEPWVRQGGFTSPNKGVDLDAYPDDETARAAAELASAPSLSFDLTDLMAPEVGSTPGKGMWHVLREFLADPSDPEGTAQRLEEILRDADSGP